MSDNISVEITDNTGAILEAIEENADRTLEALGLQAAGYAALELESDPARVDTGLLRNSIAYAIAGELPQVAANGHAQGQDYHNNGRDKNGNPVPAVDGHYQGKFPRAHGEHSVYIGSNVSYSVYVHEGHSLPGGGKVAPNRFLRNAITKHKDEYARMIEKGMKGEL